MAEGSQKTRAEASSSTTHPPSRHLYCPISKKRLRLKEIVTLHPLTHLSDPKGDSTTGANVKWICAISKKEIGYKAALAIVPTGQVILQECLRNGLVDGFVSGKNKKLTDADFVNLVPGGTGFVSHNKVEAKLVRPVME